MATYLLEYQFEGDRYSIDIIADSQEEAEKRVRAIRTTASYGGGPAYTIPVPSMFERIILWLVGKKG